MEYVPWKNVCFVSFPLLGFTAFIKLRNFNSETHENILIFLVKNDVRFEHWTCTIKHCLIWFKIHCSSSIFEIIWEMWILNFNESLFGLKVVLSFFLLFLFFVFCFGLTCIFWHYYRNSLKLFASFKKKFFKFLMILRYIKKFYWKFCI